MVPTPTQTSRFDEPSSGSNTTQYLPPSTPRFRIVGSSFSSDATTAMRRAAAEASHEDVVGDDVELLLGLAVHVGGAVFAEHVLDTRAAHLRRNRLRGQGQRRQHPREVARGALMLRFSLQNVRLERRNVQSGDYRPSVNPELEPGTGTPTR